MTAERAFVASLRPAALGTSMSIVFETVDAGRARSVRARVIAARLDPTDAARCGFEVVFEEPLAHRLEEVGVEQPTPRPPRPYERRRHPRVAIQLEAIAELPWGGERFEVVDVSMTGAFLLPAQEDPLHPVSPGDGMAAPIAILVAREGWLVHVNGIAAAQEGGQSALSYGGEGRCGTRFVRKNGSTMFADVALVPIAFDGAEAAALVARDVSDQKQLASKMLRMDRMMAMGTLAAGVGHEINNPLCYVIANVDFALQKLPEVSDALRRLVAPASSTSTEPGVGPAVDLEQHLAELRQVLEEAREGAERVRKIVRDVGTFSRPGGEQVEPVNVHRVLEAAINISWNEIRHRARLVKEYGHTPPVLADDARLVQVFLNLLVNAAHAIPEGHSDANEIRLRTGAEGSTVFVEVRDSGHGIAPDVLPHVFDAFFTTKAASQGTGLGLAICRDIVTALGGTIHVRSKLGLGATFRVTLRAADMSALRPATKPSRPVPAGRRGNVLVVDDEPLVRQSIERVLKGDHEVVCAWSGRAALELLTGGARFDVILCDLMMPELGGMELYEELADWLPEQADRMIFMSGGAFTPRAREFLERVPNQRLAKPFDLPNIRALLRQLVR